MPRDQGNFADLARTWEALFGRVSTHLGPTNPRWNTFSGEMRPEDITSAIDTANAGLPFRFCDMLRRGVEQDAHFSGCLLQTFSTIIAKPDSIDPMPSLARDPIGVSVAHWFRAVREQVEDFDAARFGLLWGEGPGFSGAENIYGWRRIVWYRQDGRRISRDYLVPVKLELVEGRGFVSIQTAMSRCSGSTGVTIPCRRASLSSTAPMASRRCASAAALAGPCCSCMPSSSGASATSRSTCTSTA